MVANGAINFPSSQFLYVICGYLVSTGTLLFIPTVIVGALGNAIGNTISFLLVKKYGEPLARKLLVMDKQTFTKVHGALHDTFSKRGMGWLFIGKLIPSIKAFIPVVAGLAETSTIPTITIFTIASLIWACAVTSLGFYFGEHVSFSSISSVSLIIALIVVFVVYKKFKDRF